jgi:hypothetical protein
MLAIVRPFDCVKSRTEKLSPKLALIDFSMRDFDFKASLFVFLCVAAFAMPGNSRTEAVTQPLMKSLR